MVDPRAPGPPRGLKTPGRGWADMGPRGRPPGGSRGRGGGEYRFPMASPLPDPTQDQGRGGGGRTLCNPRAAWTPSLQAGPPWQGRR